MFCYNFFFFILLSASSESKQRDDQGRGRLRFHPLPLETNPESRGSGSGKRRSGCRQAPTTIGTVRRVLSGIGFRKFVPAPNASTRIFIGSLFLRQKSVFLLDRARPVFFGKTKENGGCNAGHHHGTNLWVDPYGFHQNQPTP